MKIAGNDFKIAVNRHKLDEEWERHLDECAFIFEEYADASEDYDEKKETAELLAATIEDEIQAHPEDFGLTKVTAGLLATTVAIQPTVMESRKEERLSKGRLSRARKAVELMDHRRSTLKKLADLWQQDYFGGIGQSSRTSGYSGNEDTFEDTRSELRRRRGNRQNR